MYKPGDLYQQTSHEVFKFILHTTQNGSIVLWWSTLELYTQKNKFCIVTLVQRDMTFYTQKKFDYA